MPTLTLQKIKEIDQKITELKQTQEKLQQHLESKIISLLKTEKAFAIDFEILYGAIYELTQKLKHENINNLNSANPCAIEIANWRQLGLARLNKGNGKSVGSGKKTNSKIDIDVEK